ncbi:nuclear factor of activated T cells 2 interacting protein [Phyllostomus discolor]|nr:nuclear factor of activated T cells 2 interacting protein [Phyllostomus discolor]
MADSSSPHAEDPPVPESPWKKKLRSKAEEGNKKKKVSPAQDTSPLPPSPPRTKSRKHTRALRKLREVNRRLQDLRSCLSPKQRQGQDQLSQDDEVVLLEGPVLPRSPRLFPLKIRCRADLVRLPVRMTVWCWQVLQRLQRHPTCCSCGCRGKRNTRCWKSRCPGILLSRPSCPTMRRPWDSPATSSPSSLTGQSFQARSCRLTWTWNRGTSLRSGAETPLLIGRPSSTWGEWLSPFGSIRAGWN